MTNRYPSTLLSLQTLGLRLRRSLATSALAVPAYRPVMTNKKVYNLRMWLHIKPHGEVLQR
ncbi:MAG: hypothetical protein NZL87_08045, partial [Thermomicrobium sp.]|nr:hypothetical protein [Thermomicrobium sp.]